MSKKDVKCKRIFGVTICKFNNGQQITLPTNQKYGIPLTIYTSKKVNTTPNLYQKVQRMNRRLSKPFFVQELDVEQHPTPNQVMKIPTIMVGNQPITDPNFNENVLLRKASIFSKNE